MFMHGGLLHLGGNMLFLWIFGNNVEDAMGHVKFVVFYLLGGVAALALQVVIDPNSTMPTLGASGAIAGVLGGYMLLFPRARVVTVIFIVFFFTILELPAMLVLGVWFVQQALFGLRSDRPGGGVAYFAHIGGFVFGLAAIRLFAQQTAHRSRQTRSFVYTVMRRASHDRCSRWRCSPPRATCSSFRDGGRPAAGAHACGHRRAAGLGDGAAGRRRHGAVAARRPARTAPATRSRSTSRSRRGRRCCSTWTRAGCSGAATRPRSCRSPR